jgi:hypothetical protein
MYTPPPIFPWLQWHPISSVRGVTESCLDYPATPPPPLLHTVLSTLSPVTSCPFFLPSLSLRAPFSTGLSQHCAEPVSLLYPIIVQTSTLYTITSYFGKKYNLIMLTAAPFSLSPIVCRIRSNSPAWLTWPFVIWIQYNLLYWVFFLTLRSTSFWPVWIKSMGFPPFFILSQTMRNLSRRLKVQALGHWSRVVHYPSCPRL